MPSPIGSYDDFFLHYLRQHRDPNNRRAHACGTIAGAAAIVLAFLLHHPGVALVCLPIGYAFAWFGHFVIEGNTPATFGHPWWSFRSEFRMLGLMFTGRLGPWLARAEAPENAQAAQSAAGKAAATAVAAND